MKEEITGFGPAFPSLPVRVTRGGEEIYIHTGMTLRDYFAAKAMQAAIGLIPNMKTPREGVTVPQAITDMAYEYADAMLEARK